MAAAMTAAMTDTMTTEMAAAMTAAAAIGYRNCGRHTAARATGLVAAINAVMAATIACREGYGDGGRDYCQLGWRRR